MAAQTGSCEKMGQPVDRTPKTTEDIGQQTHHKRVHTSILVTRSHHGQVARDCVGTGWHRNGARNLVKKRVLFSLNSCTCTYIFF